jgi:hypothetical protein
MGKNPGKEEMMPTGLQVFIPIVFFVMFFSYCAVKVWVSGRKKEREAFYKSETLRRITEAPGESAKAAIELIREERREESRMERIKKYEVLTLGGLVSIGFGAAMMIFLHVQTATDPRAPYLVGLIPCFIGVAMLVYVYALARHREQGPKD